MKTPTLIPDVRALVHLVAVVTAGDESSDSEILLDAVMTAFFSNAEKSIIRLLYAHGPLLQGCGFDAGDCSGLEDQLQLVTPVVMAGGKTGLALNSFGEPYGRLLAAQK